MDSLSVNKMKFIRSLHKKAHRDQSSCFLVEGEKMVAEVLASIPDRVVFCVATPEFSAIDYPNVEFYRCTSDSLRQCSTLKTPNKVIAVVRKPKDVPLNLDRLILALDGVQDPGNLGTIMRLSAWFGVRLIVCSPSTVDCYNPKVIQASMGAFLYVHVVYTDLATYFQQTAIPIYGTFIDGESLYSTALNQPSILLMGNEGNGISQQLSPYIHRRIAIPSFGHAQSLNVGVATAIFLSEFFRP